jgi:hypothetical protein
LEEPHPSRSDLLACRRGLFDRHHRHVYVYCRRRTDAQAAADRMVETFLAAWRRIDDVPAGDVGLGWLSGVARRVLGERVSSRPAVPSPGGPGEEGRVGFGSDLGGGGGAPGRDTGEEVDYHARLEWSLHLSSSDGQSPRDRTAQAPRPPRTGADTTTARA